MNYPKLRHFLADRCVRRWVEFLSDRAIPIGLLSRRSTLVSGGVLSLIAPGGSAVAGEPTFSADVAPIIYENCASCHRPEGVGPFSLLTFEQIRRRARQIAEVVDSGYMPPWKPASGHGPALIGDRSLSAEDKATLLAWCQGERLAGDPALAPPQPEYQNSWQLGEPDLVLEFPGEYTVPAEGVDEYRHFILSLNNEETKYVRAVEIIPRAPSVVHHASIMVDTTGMGNFEAAGMSLESARYVVGWTPGQRPHQTYPGTVWELPPQTNLDLQLHLLPAGRPVAVNPVIGLYFTDEPPTRATARLHLRGAKIDIPAGQPDYRVEESIVLPVSARLLRIYPHAHYLGKDMRIFVDFPDGTRHPLLHIPDWDFNWQSDYRFKDPPRFPAQSRITMRYIFDNSADNPRNPSAPPRRVVGGYNSSDEMAEANLQFLLDDFDDFTAFQHTQIRYEAEAIGGAAPALYLRGTKLLNAGRDAQAHELFALALKHDPEFAPAHNILGTMAQAAGDLALAEQAYLAAVRFDESEPGYQLNLARILAVRDNLPGYHAVLAKLLETHPEQLEARLLLAKSLEENGQADRALQVLRAGLDAQPTSAPIHHRLGFVLLNTGDPNAAYLHFQSVLEHAEPETDEDILAEADFGLALLFHGVEESAQAERHLRRALAAKADLSGALLFGVDIALSQSDLPTARDRAQRLARLPGSGRPSLAAVQAYPISAAAQKLIAEAYRAMAPDPAG